MPSSTVDPRGKLATGPELVRIDRYVVLGPLGEGAMGVVYRAYDESLDRKVALKLLHAQRSDTTEGRLRLQREAQALAQLSHPNVVQVYDVGEWNGQDFITLELVRGQTLRAWLARHKPAWSQVVEVFVQAGRGLAAAHAAGLVHRDFKPDNVMIAEDGRVRVTDFGLALALGSDDVMPATADLSQLVSASVRVTAVGTLVGTPAYMAPEQLQHLGADARSDQFSFCVALYEALYGRRPFAGETIAELSFRVILGKRSPPPPRTPVPGWVEAVLGRGLAPEPGQRFPSMDALLVELTRDRGRTRRRLLRAAAVVGGLAAIVGGVIGQRRWDEARRADACVARGAAIDADWNDAARAGLRDGLRATGIDFAATTAERVIPHFDAQADAWRAATTQACADTRVRGAWTEDLLDRASWCLDERRMELAALVTELSRPDATSVQLAVQAAAGLRPVAPCLDAVQLRRTPPPPGDREAVRAARATLSRAAALRAAGRHGEALALAKSSRGAAGALAWPPLVAAATLAVGEAQERAGDYAGAERTLEDGYFLAVDADAAETAATAAILLVHTVGRHLARAPEGLRWARHAHAQLNHLGEPDDGLRRAAALNGEGVVHQQQGSYDAAQTRFERALAIREATLGAGHPGVASSLLNLGNTSFRRGAYDEARARFERAVTITEAALGPDHPDVAHALNSLGAAHKLLGDLDAARRCHARALEIQERALGPVHPDLVVALNNLGNVDLDVGDLEAARARYERALAILERSLGRDHPDLGALLNNLGMVDLDLGDVEGARTRHRRALAIRERAYGGDHPDVANSHNNLGLVALRAGALDEAAAHIERALAIQEHALGPDHPDVGTSLTDLGRVELARGALDRARARDERALAVLERALGPDHPAVADPLRGLGEVALRAHDPAAALAPLERSLAVQAAAGASPAALADARFLLARALWAAPEAAGRDRPRARTLAAAARDAHQAAHAADRQAEVERWLARPDADD